MAVITKAFTPRTVEQLRPRIAELTEELLTPVREAGRFDVVGDLAFPLPVTVMCELLGVPAADRELGRRLTRDMAAVRDLDAPPSSSVGPLARRWPSPPTSWCSSTRRAAG